MGRQIVKQPDGKYAIFSTTTDSFKATDLTEEQLRKCLIEYEMESAKRRIDNEINNVKYRKKPYFQFTMTYEQCLKAHEETIEEIEIDEPQ